MPRPHLARAAALALAATSAFVVPAPTRANAATSALVVPAPTRAGAATSALVVPAPTRANAATSSPWTRPFQIAGPFSRDVIPARIAFSSSGEATIAFGVFDEDFPSVSEARIVVRSPAGQLARGRRVPGADQVLDLAYDGPTLELLTGTSRTGHTCCATVRAVPFTHGGFGAGRTLATGLGGVTLGSLLALAGQRLLAAIGSTYGVWVAQAATNHKFPPAHRLTADSVFPQTLAATSQSGGHSVLAWTATSAETPGGLANTIVVAGGSSSRAPRSGHVALTLSPGRRVDELAVANGARGPTVAWTESWYGSDGTFHSQVLADDLGGSPRVRAFPVAGENAADLAFAADAHGDQVLAWTTCDALGSCRLHVVSRVARRRFGTPQPLGAVDAAQPPAAAVTPGGGAMVGWIDGGRAFVASRPAPQGPLGRRTLVSSSNLASGLTVAFGPAGQALAVWTQGTFAPTVTGAFRGP